jgi:hypothetical protein
MGDASDPVVEETKLGAQVRWYTLEKEILPRLEEASADGSRTLRSTVLRTLGRIRYYHYKIEQWGKTANILSSLYFFGQSRSIETSPDTLYYMAEALAESSRVEEARQCLKEVLRLCPAHAGALKLQEAIRQKKP